jgi:hypothetical protein
LRPLEPLQSLELLTFIMRFTFTTIFLFFLFPAISQDTLKVHFLYGSKPKRDYKDTEKKWFGGVLGGHVGIEGDSGKILNFLTNDNFHVFSNKNNRHSKYLIHEPRNFYEILGGKSDSVKKAIVFVPITKEQKQLFDSLSSAYLNKTPYDYAFFGMRCGAAAYEILAQHGILPRYSIKKTSKKIFYPKKLRQRLFKKAIANNWTIWKQDGSSKRIWEED